MSRRSFHLALPLADPRSERIGHWLDQQPAGADLSALLRGLICAGLEQLDLAGRLDRQELLLRQLAADMAELRRTGVAAPVAPAPDPADPALGAEDLTALSDLFGSFDSL